MARARRVALPERALHLGADQRKQAFVQVAAQIAARVERLCALPDDKILGPVVRAIGKAGGDLT